MTNAKVILNTAIPTTSTPYSAGDSIGGKILEYPGQRVNSGKVEDVFVLDASNQGAAFNIIFFSADPTASTITDNAAFVLHANDSDKVCGVIGVLSTDYLTMNSKKWADVPTQVDVNWFIPRTDDGSIPTLWVALVAVGTPTYGANSTSLYVKIKLGDNTPV